MRSTTAWRRLDLLAAADQATLRGDFRDYLDARLSFYSKLPNEVAAAPDYEHAEQLEDVIWTHAVDAVSRATLASAATILLPAINHVFDVATDRTMALQTHPPLAIYVLLICSRADLREPRRSPCIAEREAPTGDAVDVRRHLVARDLRHTRPRVSARRFHPHRPGRRTAASIARADGMIIHGHTHQVSYG